MMKKAKSKTNSNRHLPKRGEVYLTALDPTIGRELQKTRPAVIISNNLFNKLTDMVIVLPVTSGYRAYAHSITIKPPEGGVKKASRIVTEQVRSVDKKRLIRKLGKIKPITLFSIEQSLQDLFGLPEGNILP